MEKSIPKMLSMIALLNLLDCLFTLYGFVNNYIVEINPINDFLLKTDIAYFIIFKLLTTLFLILAYQIKGVVSIYIKFYGAILLYFVLTVIYILHINWIVVIFFY